MSTTHPLYPHPLYPWLQLRRTEYGSLIAAIDDHLAMVSNRPYIRAQIADRLKQAEAEADAALRAVWDGDDTNDARARATQSRRNAEWLQGMFRL